MSKPCFFVANWKMQLSYTQTIDFCKKHRTDFESLAKKGNINLVLCPTTPVLAPVARILQDTSIALGAQDCSAYQEGAYTGEVSARSLAELGCSYCLVGHSERRFLFGENDENNARKVELLTRAGVVPIVCVGETLQEHERGNTVEIIEKHLRTLMSAVCKKAPKYDVLRVICAYEPIWAVGTGQVAAPADIEAALKHIKEWFAHACPQVRECLCLYGGSVNEQNISRLRHIPALDGFLVGGASLDFQKLQNMIP